MSNQRGNGGGPEWQKQYRSGVAGVVPAGGNGNRHRPRGSRTPPPRPHRGPAGCYRRRKTGRPRITSPWTCAPHRTGNPRVFELHSPLSAEEFRSLRSKRCSAYARRQTATGQTTGRMRTPKHGGRRRRRAKAGRATTRHDGGPGANPAPVQHRTMKSERVTFVE